MVSDTRSVMLHRSRSEDLRSVLRKAKKRFVNVIADATIIARAYQAIPGPEALEELEVKQMRRVAAAAKATKPGAK